MTVQLSPSQKAVVDHFPHFLMDEETEMTISGFAGSGKTFLVSYLANISDKIQKMVKFMDRDVPRRKLYFTATTNKAAAVLQEMLGVEARTIHSLLGLKVQNNFKTGAQVLIQGRDAGENLNSTIVFVDEASMINRELLLAIRKAQKQFKDCKVVYIGDEYQLPPVKEDVCPVFEDGPNTVRLKEIQRQLAHNPIIQLSAEYRNCLDDHTLPWPVIKPDGIHICHYEDKDDFFDVIRESYTTAHKPHDLKILAWSNQRVREYNHWIRRLQGLPDTLQPGEMVTTTKPLMSDDKIVLPTDSMMEIRTVRPAIEDGIKGHTIRINGQQLDFFQPWDWKEANDLANVYAKDAKKTRNWEPVFHIRQQWADLRPIHASTIHKAQGSTYREVFVDLNNIGNNNLWREVARLTYVGITRASHRVHMYGTLKERYNRKPVINLMEPFKNVELLRA